MTEKKFNDLLDYIIDNHICTKMCNKSAEYSKDGNKLHNFLEAGKEDNITPEEALRGMDLKHRVSIRDMLDDLNRGVDHTKALWLEKICDHCNYQFLLLALLYERYSWEI